MDGAIPEASVRMSLFTKYGELQMWLLSRVVWYAALFYLVTLVAFAVLRLFTGVSIKRIGYFNLRHIVITPKQGVEIRIGKLGLSPHRPTVARPGLLTFIVSNLEVVVDLDTIIKHEPEADAAATHQRQEDVDAAGQVLDEKTGNSAEKNADELEGDNGVASGPEVYEGSTGTDANSAFPDKKGPDAKTPNAKPDMRGIPIVPKKSPAFKILRWVIQTLRVFDFQMVSTAVAFTGLNSAIATTINLRVDMRKTRNVKASNFKGTLDTYKLRDCELPLNAKLTISEVYAAESLEDESPWQVFEDLKFDIAGVLDLSEMRIKELGAQLHAGRFQLDIAHLVEMLDRVKEMRQQKISQKTEETTDQHATDNAVPDSSEQAKILSARDRQRMVRGAMMLLHLVNRLQLTLGAFEVLRVPVLRNVPDPVFFAMSMKDFNLDLSRMNPLSSGFKLMYDEGDVAHQAILTVASLTAGIDTGSEQEEVLYIPMLTSLTRGNMFSRTLRFVQDDDEEVHNESTIRSRWAVHSPNLTVEQLQIATIMRVILGHAAQSESKKQRARGHDDVESHGDTPEDRLRKSGKISVPFAKSLPKVDIDLTISDPTLRLLCETGKHCQEAMFVSSCQRMFTTITAQHRPETDSYGAQLSFETAENQIWYRSAAVPRFDLSESESAHLTVKARTHPYLEVELDGSHSGFHITALHHEIFYAVGLIQRTISGPLKQYRKSHPKPVQVEDPENGPPLSKIGPMRKIPAPIARMRFVADKSSVSFATDRFREQENEIMGLMFSLDHVELTYETGLKHMNMHTSTDGRRIGIKGTQLGLYKVDKMFLNKRRRDEELIARNTICELPVLEATVNTHTGFISALQLSVMPRLKLALNINLILAYSVVREALDMARGAHRDLGNDKDDEEIYSTPEPSDSKEPKKNSKPKDTRTEIYTLDAFLARALIKFDLPSDDQVMIELCSARVSSDWLTNPSLHAKSLRMFSEHPFERGAWCVLMSLLNLKAEYNLLTPEIKEKIMLDLDGFRINIPYKFKLYRIIDNGITLAKSIKTLLLQTKQHNTTLFLDPKVIKELPNIPRTRIKSKQLIVSLEDDHFEADLTLVMLAQQRAAESRRHKTYMFDRRIKSMIKKGRDQLIAEEGNLKHSRHRSEHNEGRSHQSSPQPRNSHDGTANGQREQTKSNKHEGSDEGEEANGHQANGQGGSCRLSPFGTAQHNVHDTMDHVASGVRHRANAVFGEHSREPSHNNLSKLGGTDNAIGNTMRHIPRTKIEALLTSGLELGSPADDGDAVLHGEPWLEFWASPMWEEFRKLPVPLESGEPSNTTVAEARLKLLHDFDRMWIDIITQSRQTQHLGVHRTRNEVVVDEMDPDTCYEERIVGYSEKPVLMAVDFRKLDLIISKTEHDTNEKLHKFLNKIGKGLPMDTEYSILVPLYVDLKAQGGLNVKLKDFPLPVLNFPPLARDQDPSSNCALRIKGNLIVTEQMMHSESNIRKLFVPLKPLVKADRHKAGPDVLEVHRTLTPIKTYTDLKVRVESKYPTRVCWCSAYKPGFHGVGEGFSGFSKPPIDPSPVLGFWDKVRLTLHARLSFEMPQSPLCLMMKAGKSPYTLLNDDSGFIFAWKNNTTVEINPNDDPKSLFIFKSDKFQLMVPDYMKSDNEYLHATPSARAFPIRPNFENIAQPEKVVFDLAQQTTWKLGMVFEKPEGKKEKVHGKHMLRGRNSDFRPHYEIQLSMPEYIKDVEKYDAYRGFRSDFIHMAISVNSTPVSVTNGMPFVTSEDSGKGAKNSCYLTPGVFHHFKAWKDQFRSEQWPPIKTGSMFPDPVRVRSNNRTFGTALSTAQYQIALWPLDLSFFHQLGSHKVSQNHTRSTGVKAKVDAFVLDLHTRREPPSPQKLGVHLHGQRRWRMRTYLGEVDIKSVSVRVIEAKLRTQNTKTALRALQADSDEDDSDDDSDLGSSTADDSTSYDHSSANGSGSKYGPRFIAHEQWIDLNDYTEVGEQHRSHSRLSNVKVWPFMYTPRFGYLRRTDFSSQAVHVDSDTGEVVQKFGDVVVHDCKLSTERQDRIHANILAYRRADLEERVSDLKASLESLSSDASGNKDVRLRLKQLKELIAVGNMNISVLAREIDRLEECAKAEDKRMDGIKEAMRENLESYVDSEKAKHRIDHEFNDTNADKELAGYEGLHSPDMDDKSFNSFINRFIVHAVHLKWDNNVRDLLFRLKVSMSERNELEYVRCRRAIQYIEELVSKAERRAFTEQDEKQQSEKDAGDVNPDSQDAHKAGEHHHKKHPKGSEQEENKTTRERTREQFDACDMSTTDRMKTLFDRLQAVEEGQEAQKDHSVIFMTPRIQLVSEKSPDKCVELLAQNVEVQIVDTFSEIGSTEVDHKIERRYAVLLTHPRFFVLGEEDVQRTEVEALCLEQYSGEENENKSLWPPWLGLELCFDARPFKNFMVMEAAAVSVRYDQPNELHVSANDEGGKNSSAVAPVPANDTHRDAVERIAGAPDEGEISKEDESQTDAEMGIHGKQRNKSLLANLVVDVPQLIVNVDSIQFFSLYMIAVDLLQYKDPLVKRREDAINRVYLMSDFSGDYRLSLRSIELLQKDIRQLHLLHEQLQVKLLHEKEQSNNERIHLMRVERQVTRRTTQLMVLMRAFKSALRKNMQTEVQMLTRWSLLADSIVLRVLSEIGDPMLEMFLLRVHFSRLTGELGSLNRTSMGGVYARNLLPDAIYSQMLASYEDPETTGAKSLPDALRVRWTLLDRVGGIPVLDGVDVLLKPLHIQLEQTLADKLLDFAFPVKQNHNKENDEKDDDSGDDSEDEASDVSSELTLSDSEAQAEAKRADQQKRHKSRGGLLHRLLPGSKQDQAEVDEMLNRASNYLSIRALKIHPTKLTVSYKGRSSHNLFDLQNLVIPMRLILYENKMWTKLDVLVHLRNDIIKTLLSQSGSIMSNRLRRHRSHTDQDDRDLGLDRILTKQSSLMKSMLDGVKKDHEHKTDDDNNQNLSKSTIVEVEEDPMSMLIPEHRLKAMEDPNAPSARVLSQKQNQHHLLPHHQDKNGEGRREASLRRNGSARNGNGNLRIESSSSSLRGDITQASSPRPSSTFRGFDATRTTEQPGSPSQLRKPQKTHTTSSFFNRKSKEPRDDNASGISEVSSASQKIFGKIRKQFG